MKNFLIILFLISTTAFSQDFFDGMVAVEFNASFNKATGLRKKLILNMLKVLILISMQ